MMRCTISLSDITCNESLSNSYPTIMLGMVHHESGIFPNILYKK